MPADFPSHLFHRIQMNVSRMSGGNWINPYFFLAYLGSMHYILESAVGDDEKVRLLEVPSSVYVENHILEVDPAFAEASRKGKQRIGRIQALCLARCCLNYTRQRPMAKCTMLLKISSREFLDRRSRSRYLVKTPSSCPLLLSDFCIRRQTFILRYRRYWSSIFLWCSLSCAVQDDTQSARRQTLISIEKLHTS